METMGLKLHNVLFWGGINKEKCSGEVKWDHDIMLYFSQSDGTHSLKNPDDVVSIILGTELKNVRRATLFEHAMEYRANDNVVEVLQGSERTIVKIWGQNLNYDDITKKLLSAGAKQEIPVIDIKIPDRPPVIAEGEVKKIRFKYSDKLLEQDEEEAKKMSRNMLISNILTVMIIVSVLVFILYEAVITKYIEVPLPKEGFLAVKGDIAGFLLENIEGTPLEKQGFKSGLLLMKFTEDVDSSGINSDSHFFMKEGASFSNRLIIDKVTNADGTQLYNIGARTTEFVDIIEGFEQVNTNLFEVDAFQNAKKKEGDWSSYGELGKGNAKRIILRGGLTEKNVFYIMGLARGYVKLGDVTIEGQRFYDNLADNQSYVTALYALKSHNQVKLFGQIEKTFTPKEGRNSEDKLLFSFKTIYVRDK